MSGLEHCGSLETLHLDNNCISHLTGLGHNQKLVELRLSGQRIPEDVVFTFDIEVLESISWSLGLLDISMCRLVDPRPLSLLRSLQKLNVADNLIEEGETLSETLPHLTQLAELNVSGNPVSRQQKYRQNTIVCCECLEVLDDREVTTKERQYLTHVKRRMAAMAGQQPNHHSSPGDQSDMLPHMIELDEEQNRNENHMAGAAHTVQLDGVQEEEIGPIGGAGEM